MAVIAVRCPSCDRDKIVKRGKTTNGKQRFLCQDEACSQCTFILAYTNRGYLPSVKRQIIELATRFPAKVEEHRATGYEQSCENHSFPGGSDAHPREDKRSRDLTQAVGRYR